MKLIKIKLIVIKCQFTAPHSPRRQKLNLRMKSLSLDSPESTELHGQMRRRHVVGSGSGGVGGTTSHGGSGGQLEHVTPPSNSSRLHCTYYSFLVYNYPLTSRIEI